MFLDVSTVGWFLMLGIFLNAGSDKAPLITKNEGKLWPHNETALQMRDKAKREDVKRSQKKRWMNS